MPEPIEIVAQEMTLLRQGFTAMQARMESTQSTLEATKSTLEATQSRLREVERAKSLTGQLSSNEAEGFSVEEMRDPLTNLVEWLNKPKTLNPSTRMQNNFHRRENYTMSVTEENQLITQETKDEAVLRKFINEGPKYDGDARKADHWMSKLKQYYQTNKSTMYADEELKRCMWNCLGDNAQIKALCMGADSRAMLHYTAAEYGEKLVAQFVNVNNKQTAAEEYMKRKQTASEDVMFYLYAKQQLYIHAYPPAMRSFVQFRDDMIRGILNSDLQLQVERACLYSTSMSELTDRMRQELRMLRNWNSNPKNPNTSLVGLKDDKLRFVEDQVISTGQVQMEVDERVPETVDQKPRASRKEDLGAVNSLRPETGNFECSQRAKTRKETETKKKKVVCHNCKQPGHYSNRCPEPRKGYQKGVKTNWVSNMELQIEKLKNCI